MWQRVQEWDWLISPKYLIAGVIFQPALSVFELYIFDDWHFLFFLMVLMGVDTATGFVKHWRSNTISHEAFYKVIKKVFVYSAYLIMLHALTRYSKNGTALYLFSWVEQVGYGILMVREALSIITNLDDIHPGMVPAWFRQKLQKFHDTGKMEDQHDAQG
jgi:phage-related holin